MDQVRALNGSTGQAIQSIIPPTFQIFSPLLVANKGTIRRIKGVTNWYGDHPRQTLDVYSPETISSTTPIVVFLHGGGLIRGDKNSPQVPCGLVYANLGCFFAMRGIIAVLPNYRLVNSEAGGDNAVFPSGGEDVSLVLKWLEKYNAGVKRDVYLLGNSAGGIHASTFLFEPSFLEQRKLYISGKSSVVLKGVIEVAVPCHFKEADPGRSETLKLYYGNKEEINSRCVYGLLETLAATGLTREELAVPEVLALLGEFDPADEVGDPMRDFVGLWKRTWGDGIELQTMWGHNHLSPPLALMSGDEKGERWGEAVAKWIKGRTV